MKGIRPFPLMAALVALVLGTAAGAQPASRVPAELRTPAIEEFAEFVRAQAHLLARWPELTFQQAANTIAQDTRNEQSAPAKAAVYRQIMGFETGHWLRRLNPKPTASACLMTLAGHRGPVASVAVSADGERVISAGHDGSLRGGGVVYDCPSSSRTAPSARVR